MSLPWKKSLKELEERYPDLLKKVEKTKQIFKGEGYHGSLKGELIEVALYYDRITGVWTDRERAFRNLVRIYGDNS